MPPKFKFTKEKIIETALELVRTGGTDSLTARKLAQKLGTSSKPIFVSFSGMEELKCEVISKANSIYNSYLKREMSGGEFPPYKASGIGYIRFAKEEPELFKLLFMRDRTDEEKTENREEIRPILDIIMHNLGIEENEAYMLHLKLWVCVHGIATMVATKYLEWDMEFISATLSDVYAGLSNRYQNKM